MIVHRTFLIGTFHYEFEYLKVSLIRVFIINFVKDQFAYIKWTWRSSLMQWCGEQRLYLSYSANADCTLSQSTCSMFQSDSQLTCHSSVRQFTIYSTPNWQYIQSITSTQPVKISSLTEVTLTTSVNISSLRRLPSTFRRRSIDLPQRVFLAHTFVLYNPWF